MAKHYIIGIDLGGTNLKIALLDKKYRILDRQVLKTGCFSNKDELISAIISSAHNLLNINNFKLSEVIGFGLGFPGPVDRKRGIVHFLPNIPGWRKVNIKEILEKKINLPVFLDNDAKLMGLAEYRLGGLFKKFQNVLCLTLGTGVGGALIISGRLYRGNDNCAGEIGHIPINEEGPECNCGGRACLETYIGNRRILSEAKKIFKRNITLEELSELAEKNSKKAIGVWNKAATRLGITLTGLVNMLNLDAIIIGGGVSEAGRILFDKVKETIKMRAMSVQAENARVFKAKFGNDAGLMGCAILVNERGNC